MAGRKTAAAVECEPSTGDASAASMFAPGLHEQAPSREHAGKFEAMRNNGRRMRLLVWSAVVVAALVALFVFGFASASSSHRRAPALPREQLAGPPTSLSSLLGGAHGRPVLVVFWASWCEPCQHEAAALERFSQTSYGRDRIVGVDWNDALSGARSFIRHYGWTFSTVRDAEGTVGYRYDLSSLPTTFVLDGTGHIHTTLHGPQTEQTLHEALSHAEDA